MKYIVSGKDNRRLDGQLEIFDTKAEAGAYLRSEGYSPFDATDEQLYDHAKRPYYGGPDRYWHVEDVADENAQERMAELAALVFDR